MTHYYFKSLFYGWREVSRFTYFKCIEYLQKGITAKSGEEKEKYINSRTLIVVE